MIVVVVVVVAVVVVADVAIVVATAGLLQQTKENTFSQDWQAADLHSLGTSEGLQVHLQSFQGCTDDI